MGTSGLTSLEMLALNDNSLGPDLPESLGSLSALLALDLSDNKLLALPNRLGDLPVLKHLWLARNVLEALSESLAQLSSLETLHVHENKIERLPGMGGLKKLRTLTIARNNLENIPPSFRGLTALERLTMDHNVTIMAIEMGGQPFTELVSLAAMTIDRFVFDQVDKKHQAWLSANVGELSVMRTAVSKGKMKALLFGGDEKKGAEEEPAE